MIALRRVCLLLVTGLLLAPGAGRAEDGTDPPDKTMAPYFFVNGDPQLDQLPLKATDVDVDIAGVIADVKVTQRYRNEGTRAIEARYVFPGSTRAAVYGMQMRVGDRLIVAKIREKQQARAEYEGGEAGRQDRLAAGAAPTQRVRNQCGQHPAGRRHHGGAALHRAAGAYGR